MTRVLHVNSSPRGIHSQSLAIAQTFLASFAKAHPDATIETLNLFDGTLPAFGTHAAEAKMATFFGQEHSPEQAAAWSEARSVFDQFASADLYVFNIPMWNHGIPYPLKQWIDIVTQPGWVFGFDPATGYMGLMGDKAAFVVYSSGVYADGRPASFGTDFATSYFDDWLAFAGITRVDSIRLLGQVLDPDAAAAVSAATERAQALGAQAGALSLS